MICPHCKKPIPRGKYGTIPKEVKAKALKLHKEGYSVRDIEMLLDRKISYPSVQRLIKESE